MAATLGFDSRAAAALQSPEGAATTADLADFATAGVNLFIADTGEI